MLAHPQSLQALLSRLCSQMLVPLQSLQMFMRRFCWQMLADAGALAVLAFVPLAFMLALPAPPLRCALPLPLPSPRQRAGQVEGAAGALGAYRTAGAPSIAA